MSPFFPSGIASLPPLTTNACGFPARRFSIHPAAYIWRRAYVSHMRPDFDLLGDPVRRLMLALLVAERELCVCEFEAATALIQPAVSRQLGILREGGWVESRRAGRWMFYRLADDRPPWAEQTVAALAAGAVPADELHGAIRRLADFTGRPTPLLRRAS